MSSQKNQITKICVSSTEDVLDAEIDPRFGRCKYFVIVELADGSISGIKAVENVGAKQSHGAGISAAEQMGTLGVQVLITGETGPKAEQVLHQLGIEIHRRIGNGRVAVSEFLEEKTFEPTPNKVISKIKKEENRPKGKQRVLIPLLDNQGEDSRISLHFGHAPFFGIFDLETKQLEIKENKLNHNDPSKSPVDQVVEGVNPTIVYAQDIGSRAIKLFQEKNIKLKTGLYNTVGEVMNNFDKLEDLTNSCGE